MSKFRFQGNKVAAVLLVPFLIWSEMAVLTSMAVLLGLIAVAVAWLVTLTLPKLFKNTTVWKEAMYLLVVIVLVSIFVLDNPVASSLQFFVLSSLGVLGCYLSKRLWLS